MITYVEQYEKQYHLSVYGQLYSGNVFFLSLSCHQGNTADPGVVGMMGSPGKQVRLKQGLIHSLFYIVVHSNLQVNIQKII